MPWQNSAKGYGGARDPKSSKGLFQDGKWLCDCQPPLLANHFQAKKGKPENAGKWFYTCQKTKDDQSRCNFFLWQSDAAPREAAALRNNSRTEPGRTARAPPTPARRAITPPPPYSNNQMSSARKRNRPNDQEEDTDEFGLEEGGSMFEDGLDRALTAVETPRKAIRTDVHATPSRRLNFGQDQTRPGMITPQTGDRFSRDPFNALYAAPNGLTLTPHARRTNYEGNSAQTPAHGSSSTETPTSARSSNTGLGADLEEDVMEVLRENNIALPSQAYDALRKVLKKHANISEGHRRGRDVLRLDIKAKEQKLVSIEQRNISLQAEIDADRAARQFAEWAAEHGEE